MFISPHIRRLIDLALDEDDIGFDVSSVAFFSDIEKTAQLLAKEDLVVCGIHLVQAVFDRVDPKIRWDFDAKDGDKIKSGTVFGNATGPALSLLRGERVALNFMQRMSGVSTKTNRFSSILEGSKTKIVDTRKTLPGWRELDKYAVRIGGGANHRFSLSGGVMVKDNHIFAAGSVKKAVERARESAPHTLKIEVEVDRWSQLDPALEAGADIIMLDNMTTEEMKKAIAHIAAYSERVIIEASGNITIERLPELKNIGLDIISSGALTHSVSACDISMKLDLS